MLTIDVDGSSLPIATSKGDEIEVEKAPKEKEDSLSKYLAEALSQQEAPANNNSTDA